MTNLFAFTDPCEPMCDMCTPLEMTPIYVQLKAEYELSQTLARVNLSAELEAIKQGFIAIGNAGMSLPLATRPADQYTLTRKPLLKNRKRR